MKTPKAAPKYFSPTNREGYWRATIKREMEKMAAAHPGIFSTPQVQQEAA